VRASWQASKPADGSTYAIRSPTGGDGRRPAWGWCAHPKRGLSEGHLLGEVGAPVLAGLCVAVAARRGEELDVADDAVGGALLAVALVDIVLQAAVVGDEPARSVFLAGGS
jgi:hypothetical protein